MTAATDTDSTTARRDLLLMLLSRFERGVITDRERPLLRPLVEAEMATLDQLDAPNEACEEQRKALCAVFNLRHRALWPEVTAVADQVQVANTDLRRQLEQEAALHEEHRRSLAVILDLPADADWLAVTRRVTAYRRQLDTTALAAEFGAEVSR